MLDAGTKLGPYEILSPLGAGGMGEVYRAKDTKLRREVAIKVLPAEVASSPERLQRFEREATTVAALNHPNIVTIHVRPLRASPHWSNVARLMNLPGGKDPTPVNGSKELGNK